MDTQEATIAAPQARNRYDSVNVAWPVDLPPITRIEARRALHRLQKWFRFTWWRSDVRRCWIAVSPPYNTLRRGWRRLVHDCSHIAFRQHNRRHAGTAKRRAHDPAHAKVEREMIAHVIDSRWLEGLLKPAKRKPAPADDRMARCSRLIDRWEAEAMRAARREGAWAKKRRHAERAAAHYRRKLARIHEEGKQ